MSQTRGEAETAAGDQRICLNLLGSLFKGQRLSKPGNGGGRIYTALYPRRGVGWSWKHTLLCSCSSPSCSPLPVLTEALTACCAVVTDDGQEIVGGDLGDTLLGQERSQIQPFQGEGDVAVDLEGIHHLVSEPFQVDAKNLKDQRQRTPKYSSAMGILIKQHISLADLCKSSSPVSHESCWHFWSRYRTWTPHQTALSVLNLAS